MDVSERPVAALSENISDDRLITLAQAGKAEAVALLVKRYSPMLQSEVSRYGNGISQRDDLAQEGFLGLLSAVRTYREDGGATFATYAYTCVRNRVVSAVRRIRVMEHREESPETEGTVSETVDTADPAAVVQQKEESDRLANWLSRELSPLEYRVLLLHLDGYSYEEMARRLRINTKAVDNALQRIRRKLSGRFGKQ